MYSTDGTDSSTIPVDITAENIINKTVISCEFYLTPDGETITPVDDVAILLKCAEIKDKSYTTMDELLADEQAMGDITMSENAMKYLARSTGFADAVCANETFMTLLGQSAYVDATVLNSDLWKQKIKTSQYWSLVYTTAYTIHAGASETITIDGVYGSFTTNTDGTVNHALPLGELTLHGSVSDQSFTHTITKDTTDVYVMPEGALYWYGNECTHVTGGWSGFRNGTTSSDDVIAKNTNSLYSESYINSSNNWVDVGYITENKIDRLSYTALKLKIKTDGSHGTVGHGADVTFGTRHSYFATPSSNLVYTFNISDVSTPVTCIVQCSDNNLHRGGGTVETYAIWLE